MSDTKSLIHHSDEEYGVIEATKLLHRSLDKAGEKAHVLGNGPYNLPLSSGEAVEVLSREDTVGSRLLQRTSSSSPVPSKCN